MSHKKNPFSKLSPEEISKRFSLKTHTPKELNQLFGFGGVCKHPGCSEPPVVKCKIFYPLAEYQARNPEVWVELVMDYKSRNEQVPVTELRASAQAALAPYLKVFDMALCESHKAEARMEVMRQMPSWCYVEWDEGPNPTNAVSVAVKQ